METRDRAALRLFVLLVVGLAAAAYVPVVHTGSLQALGGLALPFIMWAPGLAALITSALCYRNLAPLGGGLRRRTWPWLAASAIIPIAYTVAIYVPLAKVGLVRLGGPHLSVGFLVVGTALSGALATGEELGWRGLFAPLMTKRFGFVRGSVMVGVFWLLYHVPALLCTEYAASPHPVFGIVVFGFSVIGLSLFLGAVRALSSSMWPAALFHATHNLIFLHVFDPIEKQSDSASWWIGEQGAALTLVMAILAAVGWILVRRRDAEPQRAYYASLVGP